MNAYGCDGMTSADAERAMAIDLDAAQENAIQAALEDRAETEISTLARPFTDWLADSEHAQKIAEAVVYWPTYKIDGYWPSRQEVNERRQDNITEAVERMRAEYVQYRVNAFDNDERAEVEDAMEDAR